MSGVLLGAEFTPLAPPAIPVPSDADVLAARLDLVLGALGELQLSLAHLPVPQIHLDAPDLSAVVNAVNGLKPSVGAEELAAAVRDALVPSLPSPVESNDRTLTALGEVLQKLEFRLRASGNHTAAIMLPNDPTRQLGHVTVDKVVSATDARTLTERMFAKAPQAGYTLYLDTADPTYIYIAECPLGSAATATVFQGVQVTKDANGNPLGGIATATGFAWASRSTAGWAV